MVKKIGQKSEIECLEGMMGAGNTNRMCCGWGPINMCSPCGVCFRQCLFLLFPANAAYAAQYKGRVVA